MTVVAKAILVKTLKDQVYEYLRNQIQAGELLPGSSINMDKISKKLGISITPLRDALLKLETQGFVNIFPRRGIRVNHLTLEDVKNAYQIIGSLEASALLCFMTRKDKPDVAFLRKCNVQMKAGIEADDFDRYYKNNLNFHNFYILGAGNLDLIRIVENKRRRLYDFQRVRSLFREWEEASIIEHQQIIDFLTGGEYQRAAEFIRDVHWSFGVQEGFIKKYYKFV
jgi:DNA-binding GntR family transcriptional regulator